MSVEDAEISVKNNRVGGCVRFEGGGGSFRILGRFVEVGETSVFCWLRALHRNKSECMAFYGNPREWDAEHLQPIVDREMEHIRAALADGVDTGGDVADAQATAALVTPWLERPRFTDDSGEPLSIVYEVTPWVEAMRAESVRLHWSVRLGLLRAVLEGDRRDCPPDPVLPELLMARRDGRGFVGLWLEPEGEDALTQAPAVVLVGVLGPDAPISAAYSETRLVDLARRIRDAWRAATGPTERLDAIAAHASRCYPEVLTWDDDLWLAIERDQVANLALSAEEEGLLQDIASEEAGRPRLPLFLHGRAGSGKSTMLARVFAAYYDRWRRDGLPGRPLFLTLSESLLDHAREEVRQLLGANHNYLTRGPHQQGADDLDPCFRSFTDLLSEGVAQILDDDDARKAHFRGEDRVSFSVFKQLYTGENLSDALTPYRCLLPGRDRVTSELAWHVIRTFLKGWTLDGPLDVEAYRQLPRRDHTVSAATFERVYNTIWAGWYRDLTSAEGPLWDDQDRIRLILQNEWIPADYTALFCDESQDFTRIELEWILRLSVLGRLARHLPPGMPCLPFMFAGDPLQTLNPTGFRWAALRAAFTEELARITGKENLWTPSFAQLNHNYRSAQDVVRVVNLLQLWRARTLGMRDIQPQRAWSREHGSATLWVLDQNTTAETLREHLSDAIVIVPAEECGEDAYIARHPALSELLLRANGRYAGVFTALGAKGLEFDRVVVFGFGESAPDDALVRVRDADESDVEKAHFFNKLYVAASRARKELVILDTPRGYQRLWARLRSADAALDAFEHAASWRPDVGDLHLGVRGEMQYARMDPRIVADTLFQSGLRDRDPDLLQRAKQFYHRAGDLDGQTRAEAWRLRTMGSYEAAGNTFLQLGQSNEALDCFWTGAAWSHIHAWYRQHPPVRASARAMIAAFYASDEAPADRLTGFARGLNAIGADVQIGADRERWERVIEDLARLIVAPLAPTLGPSEWSALAGALQDLGRALPPAMSVAGRAWAFAGQPARAVQCWDLGSRPPGDEYSRAKAASTSLPERLIWLEKLGDWSAIVAAWEAADHPPEATWSGPASAALLQLGRAGEATRLLTHLARWAEAAQALARPEIGSDERATLARTLLTASLEAGKYDAVLVALRALGGVAPEPEVTLWAHRALATLAARRLRAQDPVMRLMRPLAQRHILERKDWSTYLELPLAGWLAETCLDLKYSDLQQFYRSFLDADSGAVRLFAQQRYLNVTAARSELDEKSGRSDQAARLRSEVQQKEREWGLPPALVDAPLEAPIRLEEALALEPLTARREREDLREVPGYEIRRLESPPVLAITSLATLESARVDVAQRRVRGPNVARGQALKGGATWYQCDALKLRVEFESLPDRGTRVKLNIGGHDRVAVFPPTTT